MKKQKIVNAWVFLKCIDPIKWEWFCFPFLRVRMTGHTKTPTGAKRAAKRTIERLGYKTNIKILWPKFVARTSNSKDKA